MTNPPIKTDRAAVNRPIKALGRSFMRAIGRLLADEHRCSLPGNGKTWPATHYQCPECGRRWQRSGHLRAPWSHIRVGTRGIGAREPFG